MNMRWSNYLLLAVVSVPALFAQQPKESLLIGSGDLLHVEFFDTPELEETARVTDSGDIPLKVGGAIHVASLTPGAAAAAIQGRLKQEQLLNDPHVLVTVVSYSLQAVTVYGQVMKPGAYEIDTPRSVIDVLALAGGFNDMADHHITIERHQTGEHIPFDVKNLRNPAKGQDLLVEPGDKVLVAKAGVIYILGDVGRPGGYAMTDSASGLTTLQAISLAGGTLPSAAPNDSRLVRQTEEGKVDEKKIPLSDMQKGKKPDITLQENDIVYVPFSYLRNAALNITGILASGASAIIYAHP